MDLRTISDKALLAELNARGLGRLSDELLMSEVCDRGLYGRKKIMKRCPYCETEYGARAMREHRSRCPAKEKIDGSTTRTRNRNRND